MIKTWINCGLLLALVFYLVPCLYAVDDSDSERKFAADNAVFALDLYRQLKYSEENIFFSPYSISTALAMTYSGARGDTAEEMRKTLKFTGSQGNTASVFAAFEEQLHKERRSDGIELSTANSLWAQKDYGFRPRFLEDLDRYYGAGVRKTDFRGAVEESRRKINAWVEDETRGKIENLIVPGILTPSTPLVLCNAIYFKGDWAEQFERARTKDQPFLCMDGRERSVPLMNQRIKCRYAETDSFQSVEIPYRGNEVSMLILLPTRRGNIAALENDLTCAKLESVMRRMRRREVDVSLPRFTMEARLSLADTLAAMGMPSAFSRKADFSGMTGDRDLFIGAVVHKAFVEVDEKGTEAAAATGVVIMPTSAPMDHNKRFKADHPFIFAIRENETGAILFMGRMAKPD